MSKPMFIEVKQEAEVCLLRCEGRFVTGTDPEYLRLKGNAIKGLDCKKILADFREVSDIGSAGIGFFRGRKTSAFRAGI